VPEDPVPEDPVPEDPVPEDPVPEDPVPEDPVPEDPVPEDPIPEDPVPLPEPEDPEPESGPDPFKSDWPKFERKKPKPFKPGKPEDFFSEDFDNVRYNWKWLPGGVSIKKGKPGKPGVLAMSDGTEFHTAGKTADGEIRTRIKRLMSENDREASSKVYEIHFRYTGPNSYHALQVRADGYYRVIWVSGGKSTTLIGDNNGNYLPIPRWNKTKDSDEVVVTFRGSFVGAQINNVRLMTTDKAGTRAGKTGVRTKNGMKVELQRLSVSE
jgi:hypothetical protein